ncbi:hypothetical protein [Streptomyces misionensis]
MDRSVTPECVITQSLARLVTELERDDDRRGPEAEPEGAAKGVTK